MKMCPLSRNRPELCEAGLSSQMIDKQYCISPSYAKCPIYLIEVRQRNSNEFNNLILEEDNDHSISDNYCYALPR